MYQDTLSLSKFVEICLKLELLLTGSHHKQVKYNIPWFINVSTIMKITIHCISVNKSIYYQIDLSYFNVL